MSSFLSKMKNGHGDGNRRGSPSLPIMDDGRDGGGLGSELPYIQRVTSLSNLTQLALKCLRRGDRPVRIRFKAERHDLLHG